MLCTNKSGSPLILHVPPHPPVISSPLCGVSLTFDWRSGELWWEYFLLRWLNSKSFYHLDFPEDTSGRLQYLTISSFLTGILECIINVHKNKLACYCTLFMCCTSQRDIIHCYYYYFQACTNENSLKMWCHKSLPVPVDRSAQQGRMLHYMVWFVLYKQKVKFQHKSKSIRTQNKIYECRQQEGVCQTPCMLHGFG